MKIDPPKYFIFIVFSPIVFFLGSSAVAAQNVSSTENCSGGICTNLTTSLAPGATGIETNIYVDLKFSVYKKSDQAPPACEGSRQIFYAIRHGIDGSASNYEYLSHGSGSAFDYRFNSLGPGNKNRYYGIFYCWTQQISDKSSLDTLLGTLNTQGQVWQTSEFNLTTRAGIGAASVEASPTSVKMGDTISLVVNNPPDGWTGRMTINGVQKSLASKTFPLPVTAENGFQDKADNDIIVQIFNSNGAEVALSKGASIRISVGQTGPAGSSTDLAPGPSDKLYNPLPESDLVKAFLVIVQGFLGIVGIFAVMFIVVGGFQMVVASGNEEMYTKAKKTVTWAVLGLVVALLSFTIIAIVQDLLKSNIKAAQAQTLAYIKK